MFQQLEIVHDFRVMHRDFKPGNIMTGLEADPETHKYIYICDYGISKYWVTNRKDPECREHIPFIKGKPICGTIRYMGINVHRGYQQCRGDDMEGAGYSIMYFLRGDLPWIGIVEEGMTDK